MKTYNISVLVGSLRKDSFNLKIAKILMDMASTSMSLKLVPIGDLPLYNQDIDGETPPNQYRLFIEKKSSDAVLFARHQKSWLGHQNGTKN